MAEIEISPSLLAADPLRIFEEVKELKDLGVDYLHLDIMDGNFVPNLTYGPDMAKRLYGLGIPQDIHLMVSCLEWAVPAFSKYAKYLTVHVEATPHIYRVLQSIKEAGCASGVALNPGTGYDFLPEVLPVTDLVLIMSVNPGWGGQKFIQSAVKKVRAVKKMLLSEGSCAKIQVDGGVTADNAAELREAGADILVSGSYLLTAKDKSAALKSLKNINSWAL